MNSLSDALQAYTRNIMVYPDEASCPQCKRFLIDENPGAVEKLLNAGYPDKRIKSARCRCEEKKLAAHAELWDGANLPYRGSAGSPATFEGFRLIEGVAKALAAAMAFCSDDSPTILVLVGGPGTGKTHLLSAIGRKHLEANISTRYEYTPDLLTSMRATFDAAEVNTMAGVLRAPHLAKVLLLDDVGQGRPSPWVQEQITALVDQRYRTGRRLVVATNLGQNDMADQMGARLASRLWDNASGIVETVYLTAKDYRGAT